MDRICIYKFEFLEVFLFFFLFRIRLYLYFCMKMLRFIYNIFLIFVGNINN